jgi:hypothetical protein
MDVGKVVNRDMYSLPPPMVEERCNHGWSHVGLHNSTAA